MLTAKAIQGLPTSTSALPVRFMKARIAKFCLLGAETTSAGGMSAVSETGMSSVSKGLRSIVPRGSWLTRVRISV